MRPKLECFTTSKRSGKLKGTQVVHLLDLPRHPPTMEVDVRLRAWACVAGVEPLKSVLPQASTLPMLFRKRSPRPAQQTRRSALMLETLESRLALAASLGVDPFDSSKTALFITGTTGNDTIAVNPSGAKLAVTINGKNA